VKGVQVAEVLRIYTFQFGALVAAWPVNRDDAKRLPGVALEAKPGPAAQTRWVFAGGDNRIRHGAKTQKESAAELTPAEVFMNIVSEGTTECLWRPKPLVKGGVVRHFGPVEVTFAASEHIQLMMSEESS